MNIQTVSLSGLVDAPYNPRVTLKPGDAEWEKLKNSIEHFGYVEPIVVNERNHVVIGGHQRLHVMRDMGVEEAEVVLVDLDDNDEKALNIALNKINGSWDAEKLESLLHELDLGGYDTDLTGFSKAELDTLYTGCLEEAEGAEDAAGDEVYESGEEDNKAEIKKASSIKVCSVTLIGQTEDTIACVKLSDEQVESLLKIVKDGGEVELVKRVVSAIG